jgi:hypothetical protein
MLVARSSPECRLFMDLHACSCGTAAFDAVHTLRTGDNDELIAVYSGICSGCGLPRLFEFELDPRTPPLPPAYGGPNPSRIICPGQFAIAADLEARAAAAGGTAGRAALARALAAQVEILKFIPAGGSAVPAEAFTSEEGQRLYASEPHRFDADRLAAVADSYRAMLA